MGRNLDPKHKICRRYGVKLCDSFKCPVTRRNYPPGLHGQKKMRKMSDYGRQLMEKQKAKYVYGLLERQFRSTVGRAQKMQGDVGTNLLVLLERRLDNAVFKAGFASTKRLARQLVRHGHFEIDGRKTDIPSYTVRVGEIIRVRDGKRTMKYWQGLLEAMKKSDVPGWIHVTPQDLTFTIASMPKREEMPQNIETHRIIEFYSR